MVCDACLPDGPMSAVQMFNYIRHRYGDMRTYFLRDRDIIVIPVYDGMDEDVDTIRELAVRKGLNCSTVSAAWPEYLSSDILSSEDACDFLVISEIKGKYVQVY
ncbi:hypothetical protein CUJ83_00385 [Methanocella sp. CWC-04]|uniref:Uncharacterized protein n=1 Tax=Methanooceanicella nereidis TaxID=2052831 RepID=A0AAP2RCC5_9EURY|nr:hypothetical protein [Methanocella sp. CWC-04]MCD1293455.1 hypothetical protein [Methanocella sp. CWC-04]